MNNLISKNWWIAAGTRAVKTFCQAVVILIGSDQIGFLDVDWLHIVSVAGMMALVSILTSIGGIPEVNYKQHLEEIEFDKGGDQNGFDD